MEFLQNEGKIRKPNCTTEDVRSRGVKERLAFYMLPIFFIENVVGFIFRQKEGLEPC
jgi:hypothetical protein